MTFTLFSLSIFAQYFHERFFPEPVSSQDTVSSGAAPVVLYAKTHKFISPNFVQMLLPPQLHAVF